jgi:hypothetical protein
MRGLLLLPFLLAGCGIVGTSATTPQVQCEREANADPTVANLRLKVFTQTTQDRDISPDIAVAKHEAVQRCLIARGAAAPGGVQPLRPAF